MESRLPKPTGIPKFGGTAIKHLSVSQSMLTRATKTVNQTKGPLTRDLLNININVNRCPVKRAASPDLGLSKNVLPMNRTKLRRSRSACDLREEFRRPLKRTEPTLAPIPAKRLAPSTISSIRNGFLSKPKVTREVSNVSVKDKKPTGGGAIAKAAPKRIPPYDYKARYNDLLEKHKTIKAKYEEMKEQIGSFESLPEQLEDCQNELIKTQDELKAVNTENGCLQKQNKVQANKIELVSKCLKETKENFELYKSKCETLEAAQSSLTLEVEKLRTTNKDLTSKTTILTEELEVCKEQLFHANIERKDLHNQVMDLRGNIRVFCRVRPSLLTEEDRMLCGWTYLDETSLEIANNETLAAGTKNKVTKHEFSFDHVFHPRSSQEDVFEMVSPLIQSALDGYNVCIFAYGQTGSGKTFTMDGASGHSGVIPRTVDLLFESIKNYKRLGWEYQIKATFLEIYNEVLYDLLDNDPKEMEIRMVSASNKTDIYVSNIREESIPNGRYLRELMQLARMNRATACTVGNERSSRSHAVTRIQLIGTHLEKNETCVGTINLVDLAGSESPKTSVRMDETKKINRSLSELTNVILALLQRQEHIPYRNSKLTHLLMPCLGGNSKTLMFINVSPFQDCFVESVKSLRFAANVNSCKLAKAKKNRFLNTSNSF